MGSTVPLAQEIEERLSELVDASTENIRGVRSQFSKSLASVSGTAVHELALELLKRGIAPRFVAYELVQHHREASRSLNSGILQRLGRGISSWGDVDTFACFLAGPAWREHLVPDDLVTSWARSKDRCWRRAAVVSTVPLNNKARGGNGDAKRTLMICEMVLNDRDDMVVKALSWALRELAKRDAKRVKKFITENHEVLAARISREVNNKLTTGLKNPKSQSE